MSTPEEIETQRQADEAAILASAQVTLANTKAAIMPYLNHADQAKAFQAMQILINGFLAQAQGQDRLSALLVALQIRITL